MPFSSYIIFKTGVVTYRRLTILSYPILYMALTLRFLLVLVFFIPVLAQEPDQNAPFKPNSLILPTRKDPATSLHLTHVQKRTPQVSVPLLVDLNGGLLWVTCEQNYTSSTYSAPFCHSTQCSQAGVHYCHKCPSPARPGCHNNTCGVLATNPFTRINAISELALDVVSIESVESYQWATIRQFLFACAPSSLLQGPLPQSVKGIAGLGHTSFALPLQLASYFGFQPQFSTCLSRSEHNSGWIFFGNVPEDIRHRSLTYTPLTIGPNGEYLVRINSIRVNNRDLSFNNSLFSSTNGLAATTISTTLPYTVLHHWLYQTLTEFCANQTRGVSQVQPISPFGLCFNSTLLQPKHVGVPNIEFIFQNSNVSWTIYGYDALVMSRPNVSCLGFVDGGLNTRSPITIGVYQLENNFVHFDLVRSRFGFVPSRLGEPGTCSDFNFTTGLLLE